MSQVELMRDGSANVMLYVTSPFNYTTGVNISVDVSSITKPEVVSRVTLRCEIRLLWNASLLPGNGTLTIDVLPTDRVNLTLRQATNDPSSKEWSIELRVTDQNWMVSTLQRDFHLDGTASKTIELDVEPPSHSPSGASSYLRLTAKCAQLPGQSIERMYMLQVVEVHRIDLLRYPNQMSHYPGENATADFDVRNTGNVPEIFEVKVAPLYGCTLKTSIGSIEGPWFQLLPWQQATILIQLTLPVHPTQGGFSPNLTLTSTSMDLLTIHLMVRVISDDIPIFSIRLSGDNDDAILVEARHQVLRVNFTIENLRPEQYDVDFCSTVDNPRCSSWVQAAVLHLLPYGTRDNWVNLRVEEDAPFGDSALTVYTNTGDGWLKFNITVVGPDLQPLSPSPDHVPVEGEVASYSLTVANVGRGRSGPTSLIVMGPGEIQVATPAYVPSIAPGKWVNVTIVILPFSGFNKYTFIVDPNGTLRQDGNATDRLSIWLQPSPPADSSQSLPRLLWVPLILVIALILAIMALRRLQGRPVDGLESPAPSAPGDGDSPSEDKGAEHERESDR